MNRDATLLDLLLAVLSLSVWCWMWYALACGGA